MEVNTDLNDSLSEESRAKSIAEKEEEEVIRYFYTSFSKMYQLFGTIFYIKVGWATKGISPFLA